MTVNVFYIAQPLGKQGVKQAIISCNTYGSYSILYVYKEDAEMSDIAGSITTSKMLQLKQDIAYFKGRLAECSGEDEKKSIRRELMEKETHYNILADRQRSNF